MYITVSEGPKFSEGDFITILQFSGWYQASITKINHRIELFLVSIFLIFHPGMGCICSISGWGFFPFSSKFNIKLDFWESELVLFITILSWIL